MMCAPRRATLRSCPDRRVSSESCLATGEFIRRGGEWWRFWNRPRRRGDRRITFSARIAEAIAFSWVCRRHLGFLFEGGATPGQATTTQGILIVVRVTKGFSGWGRSSGRQRRRYRHDFRQEPERAAGLVVRAQRLVEGRTRASSQPQSTPDGRAPHQHRHLAGAPLARRRAAARAHSADPLRAVLRAFRRRRRRRGPRPAHRPPVTLGVRRRPALGRPADRLAAQRVLPQRPDAGAARLPRLLAGAGRRARPGRAHAALAGARPGRRTSGTAEARGRRAAPAVPALRPGAGPAGVDHRDVPPVGRAVRRRAAPQGGRRPAPRGHRPAPGAAARGHRAAAVQVRRRTGRAGRLDELRRRPAAQRPEVLRPRPARRQGGRRQAARRRTSCPP